MESRIVRIPSAAALAAIASLSLLCLSPCKAEEPRLERAAAPQATDAHTKTDRSVPGWAGTPKAEPVISARDASSNVDTSSGLQAGSPRASRPGIGTRSRESKESELLPGSRQTDRRARQPQLRPAIPLPSRGQDAENPDRGEATVESALDAGFDETSQTEQRNAAALKDKTKLASKPPESTKPRQKANKAPKTVDELISDIQGWFYTKGMHVALIVMLAIVALKFTETIASRLLALFTRNKEGTELKKRADTMSSVIRYGLIATVLAIGGMMLLKELGIDIAPILAGAGVVGVAVGFGAQSLVKDVISGFFILLEDQIRVGDVVQIADKSGVVEKVTLRMVVLRDISHNVHYIPSGEISVVTNMTKKYSGYVFDIGVAYRENVNEVIAIMHEVDEDLRNDPGFEASILEPLEMFGLQDFADSSVVIRARTKTKPGLQWQVGREYKKRLKARFDQLGIEIPFPHVTMYPGKEKDGSAPPLQISVQSGELVTPGR